MNAPHCKYSTRQSDVSAIYAQTKILIVGSLVDETYCRVAAEGILNHIPVVTTGYGNIKNVCLDSAIYVSEDQDWSTAVSALYHDQRLYEEMRRKTIARAAEISEEKSKSDFICMINSMVQKEEVVGIFTPWCDQGLGIQSRYYQSLLKRTVIFAYRPYYMEINGPLPGWECDAIYYSQNDREHVTDEEVIDFIKQFKITHFIIPETCWPRVFEVAKLVRKHGVLCYAIPNIEIVRRDEIFKHKYFTKVLCNNVICQETFLDAGWSHDVAPYIGYAYPPQCRRRHITAQTRIEFLFLGGLNAFSRKQVEKVLEAFSKQVVGNFHLTACIQKITPEQKLLIDKYRHCKHITILDEPLSYKNVQALYRQAHINIQVSKHEGLGLGFYEALSHGIPVITTTMVPHSEIITDRVNGWTIPCQRVKMLDNPDSVMLSSTFETDDLTTLLSTLLSDRDHLNDVFQSTVDDYITRFSFEQFNKRFIAALDLTPEIDDVPAVKFLARVYPKIEMISSDPPTLRSGDRQFIVTPISNETTGIIYRDETHQIMV